MLKVSSTRPPRVFHPLPPRPAHRGQPGGSARLLHPTTTCLGTSHLFIVGNLHGFPNAKGAEFPAMLSLLRRADCIETVRFDKTKPGMAGIILEDLPPAASDSLSPPLTDSNAVKAARTAACERAADQCKKRRLEDKDQAWKAKQDMKPSDDLGGRDAFLERGARLFYDVVDNPVLHSLDAHLAGAASHIHCTGDVPRNHLTAT